MGHSSLRYNHMNSNNSIYGWSILLFAHLIQTKFPCFKASNLSTVGSCLKSSVASIQVGHGWNCGYCQKHVNNSKCRIKKILFDLPFNFKKKQKNFCLQRTLLKHSTEQTYKVILWWVSLFSGKNADTVRNM